MKLSWAPAVNAFYRSTELTDAGVFNLERGLMSAFLCFTESNPDWGRSAAQPIPEIPDPMVSDEREHAVWYHRRKTSDGENMPDWPVLLVGGTERARIVCELPWSAEYIFSDLISSVHKIRVQFRDFAGEWQTEHKEFNNLNEARQYAIEYY